MLGCWLVSRNLAGGWALNCRLQGNALIEGSGDLAQTETQQSWLASRAGTELGLETNRETTCQTCWGTIHRHNRGCSLSQ